MMSRVLRIFASLAALVIAVGLMSPAHASDATTSTGDLQSDLLASMSRTTLDILNGLSQVEDSASPSLPPGQGGTPPGQPPGRAGGPEVPPGQGGTPPGQPENRPPEHAQNDKEKEKDAEDVPEEE